MKFLFGELVGKSFQLQMIGSPIEVFEEMGLNLSPQARSPGTQTCSEFCSPNVGFVFVVVR